MHPIQCIIVTPERTVRDETVDFVALPLFDGEIGIAPDHAPMIGRLGYGEMRLNRENGHSRFYIEGGFVEVLGNVVTVLTSRAVPAEELDGSVLAEQLYDVQGRPAHSDQAIELRDRQTQQLRAQLRVVRRAAL